MADNVPATSAAVPEPTASTPNATNTELASTTPVEMQDMANNTTISTNEAHTQSQHPASTTDEQITAPTIPPSTVQQQDTNSDKLPDGLGPATDLPIAALTPTSTAGPTLSITLMLTTGARHPYKIDERYLRNRKVEATTSNGSFDPREISGYKLKELIWTDWRSEWEPRPASPSSIRLIILGRLLEDKSALRDFPFKLDDANVVHMTVKPADFLDDEETGGKTGKGHSLRGHDGEDRGAGCRCVIL